MKWTKARIDQLNKELEDLDNAIKDEQVITGTLKNNAMERGDGEMEKLYSDKLDRYMAARASIDGVIEFFDGLEVKL